MPGKPSGMHTSAGSRGEMPGTGFVGHGSTEIGTGGAAAPALTSRVSATAPTVPPINVDRAAVMSGDYNAPYGSPLPACIRRRVDGRAAAGGALAAGRTFGRRCRDW